MCTTHSHTNSPAAGSASTARAAIPVAATTLAIDELHATPGSKMLVARCDDALYLIPERALLDAATYNRKLDFADQNVCRLIAAGVNPGVSVHAATRTVTFVKNGHVLVKGLEDDSTARRPPVPNMAETIVAAHLSGGGRSLLCVVRDDSDFDFSEFRIVLVELEMQRVTSIARFASGHEPIARWSPAAESFLAFDRDAGSLWRIDPNTRAATRVELAAERGRNYTDVMIHPRDPWVALQVDDSNVNRRHLLQGAVNSKTYWEGVTRLGDGIPGHFRWRPTDRSVALVRALRRRTMLDVVSTVGVTVATHDLPRGWIVNDLAWSADGEIVFAVGSTGVAVWRPFETKES